MRKTRPGFKTKRVRDYGRGSIRDWISQAETLEDLEELRQLVLALANAGRISADSLKKIDAAGKLKADELSERLIEVPTTPGLKRTPSGLVMPR